MGKETENTHNGTKIHDNKSNDKPLDNVPEACKFKDCKFKTKTIKKSKARQRMRAHINSQHVSTVVDDPKGSGIDDQINDDTVVSQIPDKNADYTIIAEITTETVTDTGKIRNVLVTTD